MRDRTAIGISSEVAKARSRLGVVSRTGKGTRDEIESARDDLAEAVLADAIRQTLRNRPSLTKEARGRLAALLHE